MPAGTADKDRDHMTQGFPAQPQYGQTPYQFPPQPTPTPPMMYGQPGVPMPAPQQYAAPAQPGGFFQTQDPHVRAEQGPAVPPMTNTGAPNQVDTTGFWGGAPSLSFDDKKGYVPGTFRGGQVLSKTISNQTDMANGQVRTWDDGSPRKQMVLLLQTNERADPQDNGQRQLFIKGDLPRACREAFQAAGASDIEIGSWVYAAWIDNKPAKKPGFNASKVYKVVYARPGQPDPMPAPAQVTPAAPQFSQPQPGQVIGQMPMPVQAYPGQGPAPQPQYPAGPAPDEVYAAYAAQNQPALQVPADQAAQFAAWQAQQSAQPQQTAPQGQPPATGIPQPQQTAPQGQQPQWSPFA